MPWAVRYECVLVLLLSCIAEIALRHVPLTSIARVFGVCLEDDVDGGPSLDVLPPWAEFRLRAVRTVMGKWPVDGVCLRDALVTGQRLRRLRPTLKLGVAHTNAGVAAHAWLEICGRSLDATSWRYATLPGP